MQILALGLNHETAPVDLREKVAFGPESLQPALRDLTAAGGVEEAAILSTCNRTEIYCGQQPEGAERVMDWFADYTGFHKDDLAQRVYRHPGEQAVKHAFRVASGLESMVLGEPQILGQMKDAFHAAVQTGSTGKILNRLFQHSFSVAKQVRTDTAIGANAVSVAYAGVKLAEKVFTRLADQRVLLIGAGETIELVARHLRENGVTGMTIANRSIDRARTLADAVGSEAITLADIPDRLVHSDIVVSSTASTLPILGKGAVERALKARRHKPIFLLDLAVPRDVEPEVGDLRNVYLYTVDDLGAMVERNRDIRVQAAQDAENIIDLQVVRFMRWMRSLDAVPTIRSFRDELDLIGEAEVDRAQRKIRNGEDPEQVVQQLARNLTRKFAHHPSEVMKQADMEGNSSLIKATRKLFRL